MHIGNSSGHIRTCSRFTKYLGHLTLIETHIKFTSLIICSINDNLTNRSSKPPPEGKKVTVYDTFKDFMYLKRNFFLLEI